jgi:hypothetical protein
MNQKPTPTPNVQVQYIPDPNPWETLDRIPHIPVVGGVLLSLLVVACAAYQLPFALPTFYTLPLLIACILALLFVMRSVAVGVAVGILFVGGYLFGGFSLPFGLALICPIMVMGLGAFLISTYRSKWLVLIPLASYITAFVMCGDPWMSIISLTAFPAAGMLAYQTMRNERRVGVICTTSLIYGLCMACGYVLLLLLQNGSVSLAEMVRELDAVREEVIALILQTEPLMQMLENTYKELGVNVREVVVSLVNLMFNLLPGMVIVLINLMAYTAQLLCTRAYVGTGMKALATKTAQLFILSVFSGVVYLFCFVVTLFSGASNMFMAVIHNLLLVLLPGMTLVGVFKLAADLKNGISRLWLLILIACAIFAPYMLILCISFSGALATLTRPFVTRMILKNQGKDGHDGPQTPTDRP